MKPIKLKQVGYKTRVDIRLIAELLATGSCLMIDNNLEGCTTMITSNLLPRLLDCSIPLVDLNNRQCWWIKQPQASSKLGKSISLNSISISSPLVGCTVFGGMGREPKKTPPLRLPSLALFCGYPIHPNLFIARGIPMIFSFLTTLNPFITFRSLFCEGAI